MLDDAETADAATETELDESVIPYLVTQFRLATPVLFTGAGFSVAAKASTREPLPGLRALHGELWSICFPTDEFDASSSFPSLVDHARLRHPTQLRELLHRRLTVDADSLPDWYRLYFGMPWYRCYTLNVDDLDVAAQRRFSFDRRLISVSATEDTPTRPARGDITEDLESVHLNGTLSDVPDRVTFSTTQYAERLAGSEPWYVRLVADLATHPFVFVGSQLDESPLWQHIAMREARGQRGLRERRPKSFLVTPRLDRARRALLADFNVHWVRGDARVFAERVLARMGPAAAAGSDLIKREAASYSPRHGRLPRVADLVADPSRRTDFLLGAEPHWADLQSGRAVERVVDGQLATLVADLLKRSAPQLLLITGTAASGKSTSLMRLALQLHFDGFVVGWVDRETELLSRQLQTAMRADDAPRVLAIDEPELFGGEITAMIGEILRDPRLPLVILAVRSGRVDQLVNPAPLGDITISEVSMPPLEDSDIDSLLNALDQDNRLGILKGLPRAQQQAAFREQAGRQLLVAMYQATSGLRFDEKVLEELEQLAGRGWSIYATVAVATSLRYSLKRDEVLIAISDASNAALNDVDALTRRGIVVLASDSRGLRARHRHIADVILDELRRQGQLMPILSGLLVVAATRVMPDMPRSARPWRFLKSLISHEFLLRVIGVEQARNLYGSVEAILHWDYHYWLQRGSLEAQVGDLGLAENFLGQARSLAASDALVLTEWAYFLFKKAVADPTAVGAPAIASEAMQTLIELIRTRGINDSYPYHVLMTQGLAWARTARTSRDTKLRLLQELRAMAEEAVRRHPNRPEVELARKDVQRAYLLLATPNSESEEDPSAGRLRRSSPLD